MIAYDEIADIYDAYVAYDFDISFFLAEAMGVQGRVLELMSGTGRVSIPLAAAGAELTCVDASGEMLTRLEAKLRERNLSAKVYRQDVRELSLPEVFDLAILPFHSFSELIGRPDQLATLRAVHRCLSIGGKFICPLHNPARRLESADGALRLTGSQEVEGGKLVVSGFERFDPHSKVVSRIQYFELYDRSGRLRWKRMLEMPFASIGADEFEALAEEAGFVCEDLYGDYYYAQFEPERSPFMIWVLRRNDNRRHARYGDSEL